MGKRGRVVGESQGRKKGPVSLAKARNIRIPAGIGDDLLQKSGHDGSVS